MRPVLSRSCFPVRETPVNFVAVARQQFLYLRRIEVQAVYHVPEIGFLVTVTALRFKPVGVDAVVVGKHLHPDGNVIRVPYQVFHYVRIVPAVNLVPDCILMFIEKASTSCSSKSLNTKHSSFSFP